MTSRRGLLAAAAGLPCGMLAACGTVARRPATLAGLDDPALASHLRASIRRRMEDGEITGLAVAIVDDQRIAWSDGFGFADKANGRQVTPDTLFRVGSVSKLFTAYAALKLAQQGRLDIDAPLARALPQFRRAVDTAQAARVTPRRLMSHHGGLARDRGRGMFAARPAPFTDLVSELSADDLPYRPGLLFSYSNIGATLLGHAVQNAAGAPFAEHLREAVLQPLGLEHASFEQRASASPHASLAYRRGQLAADPPLRDLPAGGLNASAHHLARFVSAMFREGLRADGTPDVATAAGSMFTAQNLDVPLDLDFRVGMGWMLSTFGPTTLVGAGPVAHHNGATVMHRASVYALPRHRLGIVVLANSPSVQNVVDQVATEALALALEARTGIVQPPAPADEPASAPWQPAALDMIAGDWTTIAGHVTVQRDRSGLQAHALGQRFRLVPRGDAELALQLQVLGLLPVDVAPLRALRLSRQEIAGRVSLVARFGDQRMRLGERLPPIVAPIPPRWRARIGRYAVVDVEGDHRFLERVALREEAGRLIAALRTVEPESQTLDLVLVPTGDDEAFLAGALADAGERIRIVQGERGEEALIAGYRLRRID